MGRNLYFYEVGPLTAELPEVIDQDKMELPENIVSIAQEKAKPWEKEIGQSHTIQYMTIDTFDAAEKMFGRRPSSSSAGSYYYLNPDNEQAKMLFYFPDGSNETATRAQLRPYYYKKTDQVLLYERSDVFIEIERPGILPLDEDQFLAPDDILNAVESYIRDIEDEENCFSHYDAEAVFALMRVYMMCKEGKSIVCNWE